MIGCLQPIIALYFEFEAVLKFYNLEARFPHVVVQIHLEFTVETAILIIYSLFVLLNYRYQGRGYCIQKK